MSNIKLGMTVQIAPAMIEKEKMMQFAKTYDNIPLHTDEEYAKGTCSRIPVFSLLNMVLQQSF